MHAFPKNLFSYFLLPFFAVSILPAYAEEFSGKMIGVSDRDTISALRDKTQTKIRLHGIDCPKSGQDFGSRAKSLASELSFRKLVTVRVKGFDRYRRTVAEVILPDGRSLNEELVRAGLAWWYRKYAPHDETLSRLEREARAEKRGLWAQGNPIPPWAWRQGERGNVSAELSGKVTGNTRSRVYHEPSCKNVPSILPKNRKLFDSANEADEAGFRPAKDCHPGDAKR
jgi:endonuclease YncB( thermonuclease family)